METIVQTTHKTTTFMSEKKSPMKMQVFIETHPSNVVDFTLYKLMWYGKKNEELRITCDLLAQEYRYGYIAIVWVDGNPRRLSITRVGGTK